MLAAERYMLNELPPDEREEFEAHFFDCADCAQQIRDLSTMQASAAAVFGSATPSPAKPDPVCVTGPIRGTHSPTWSPTGSALAFTQPDGLRVARSVPTDTTRCAEFADALVVPGATEPDWGPAAINPQPVPGPQPDPNPKPKQEGKKQAGKKQGALSVVGASDRKTVARKGLRVRVKGLAAGKKVTVRLRVDGKVAKRLKLGKKPATLASGSAKASKKGVATVRLKLGKKAARAVRDHQGKVAAKLTAPGAATKKVTLR